MYVVGVVRDTFKEVRDIFKGARDPDGAVPPSPVVAPTGVRVRSVPPGEAPEEVRRAWVGLELPVAGYFGPREQASLVGVLSGAVAGSGGCWVVDGAAAVEALARVSPDAAAWWREHAADIVAPGGQLAFPLEVCQLVVPGQHPGEPGA